jgi:hypothetical protein
LVREAERQSADCLVTTEKDWINLPMGSERILGSLSLFWLEIGFELQNSAEFFSILQAQLTRASRRLGQDRVSGRFKTVDS